jgi:hypothetical protein
VIDPDQDETQKEIFQEIEWEQDVTGQLHPFDLIQDPDYTSVNDLDYLDDKELVLVTRFFGELFVYPLRFMLVEVVNEEMGGIYSAITYCPITKSAVAWNRLVENDTLLLTASGYLLRDNLMPLDLRSGSIWSQMRLVGMHGKHDKVSIQTLPMFETSWLTVKTYFPEALVFIHDPLQKSAWEASAAFGGESFIDRRFGILGRTQVEVFDFQLFSGEIVLHSTLIQPGGNVVVAGSSEKQFVVAFRTNYSMEPAEGQFPIIMRDETGTGWNIFGEAVDGERKGEQLDSPVYYTASHWAWEALFARVNEFNPS